MSIPSSDISWESKRPQALITINNFFNRLFLNRYFFLFLFCLATGFVVTENEVLGAIVFIGIICLALLFCEDILATTLPFLLLCVFVTDCYNSFDIFIQYVWIAVPAVLSILFHFIVYRRKIQIGSSFWGLVAVSIALLCGGIGMISAKDYFRVGTLYYTIFLGIGMVVAYLLLKSQMCVKRPYDVSKKFLTLLYIMGIFACLVVFLFLSEHVPYLQKYHKVPFWQPSNNISTILMIALPCPFFFASKKPIHLLAAFLMLGCIICTGSRSGCLLGAVEFLICLIISCLWDKPRRFYYVCILVGMLGVGVTFGEKIVEFSTQIDWENLINSGEARFQLLERAKNLFFKNPIFGHGLGYTGNTDIYNPVEGAMEWYHMMIPQVVAGMGIVGTIAYLFQFFLQARCVWLPLRKNAEIEKKGLILTLASCYLGVLMMSQINPGLFCPLPYTLIATLIFALIDGNEGPWPMPRKRKKEQKAVNE